MDGTIYLSEQLFDGTIDFLNYVKRSGGRYLFLTNNSSRGTDAYIAKMKRLGIEAFPEDFLTSADAAGGLFSPKSTGGKHLQSAGQSRSRGSSARRACRSRRVRTTGFRPCCSGYDTELTYQKLEDCCILLGRGADYIATHPDMVCPTWYGSAPDCGSFIEMLFTATGRRPKILGKPQPDMALAAMRRTGYAPEQACILGDRVYTDIACGVNAGIDAVFLLSGEGVMADIEKYNVHPSYVFQNIRAFQTELEKGEAV